MSQERVYLSPPHLDGEERAMLLEAFDSNWIAPLGPHVDAFEQEFADLTGASHAVAVSSGTAALHLALVAAGVGPGDRVITTTSTFVATANAIRHAGAAPVFVDCDEATWTIDPDLVDREARRCDAEARPAKAVIPVDSYGQCADYDRLRSVCERHGMVLIADAAESLGSTYRGGSAGAVADIGCFSFNGNKIITTSGGGMVVTHRKEWADRIRNLAAQARSPHDPGEHAEVGFNYRLSNLLAAVGRGQLRRLDDRVRRRREVGDAYRQALGGLPGVSFMPEAGYGVPNRWLTCLRFDPDVTGSTNERVRLALESENIESRLLWKPLHLQPAHHGAVAQHGKEASVAETLWRSGLCLPSGSGLSDDQFERVVRVVRGLLDASPTRVFRRMPLGTPTAHTVGTMT